MLYGHGNYTYQLVPDWARLPDGHTFLDIGGIAIDDEDKVYVLGRGTDPITVFDPEGNLLRSWGEENHFGRAHGACMSPDGHFYCCDDRRHVVYKFTRDGRLVKTLGTIDKPSDTGYRECTDLWERIGSITHGGDPFNRPTGVTVSSAGDIYVTDGYGNARVHRFSRDGSHMFSWGQPGAGPGEFRCPHSIRIDGQNRLWVVDRENSRIQMFDCDGNFLGQWTNLIRPCDLCFDSDGIVYVAELSFRVSIHESSGSVITSWGNENEPADDPLFLSPHSIAVDSKGNLYVGDIVWGEHKIDRGVRTIHKFLRQ